MNPAPPIATAIRVNVTVPVTRTGIGPFQFDSLEQMIGSPLAGLLAPLTAGPVTRRPSADAAAVEVYPLALPDGEGASIPLGQWGEFGWLGQRLGDAIVRGAEAGLSMDGSARVAEEWVRLRSGMRASVPLGALGERAVEAA